MPLTDQEKIKAYEEAVEEIRTLDIPDWPKGETEIMAHASGVGNITNTFWRIQREVILTKLDEKLKGV